MPRVGHTPTLRTVPTASIHKFQHLEETNILKDPVCGMQVDEKKAGVTSVHKGTTHHFCSLACKTKFDTTPEKFTGKGATPVGK